MSKKILKNVAPEDLKLLTEAVITIHEERKTVERKKEIDTRLRNIRLVLKNYRKFKDFAQEAIIDIKQANKELGYILDDLRTNEDLRVVSIMQTRERTLVMIAHVDKMIDVYRGMCAASRDPGDIRRWNIFYDFYINPTVKPTADELSDKFSIDRSTVFDDINRVCEELSPLFFGFNGLK
jgi:hypothetical protein